MLRAILLHLFATVHEHGHVVGDVNQNSFMVGRDSKVVLIDSDSFQINANGTLHLCEVGVSHFTPPELQTLSSFVGFERTENHDNFGLALLIFFTSCLVAGILILVCRLSLMRVMRWRRILPISVMPTRQIISDVV